MCLKILFFKTLINLLGTIDFLSRYVEYILILYIFEKPLKEYCKTHYLNQPVFYLASYFIIIEIFFFIIIILLFLRLFFKRINCTNSFFIFYRNNPIIFIDKSNGNNKYSIPLSYILTDYISAKSTPQTLKSVKENDTKNWFSMKKKR